MTATQTKWAWAFGIGSAVAIVAVLTKDKWMPLFKKVDAPVGKPMSKGVEKSEFAGRRHGGGGRHHGGRRNYPPFPYGYGVPMYPSEYYYNPNQLCEFKDKSGKKIVANCNENIAITLQNRF